MRVSTRRDRDVAFLLRLADAVLLFGHVECSEFWSMMLIEVDTRIEFWILSVFVTEGSLRQASSEAKLVYTKEKCEVFVNDLRKRIAKGDTNMQKTTTPNNEQPILAHEQRTKAQIAIPTALLSQPGSNVRSESA